MTIRETLESLCAEDEAVHRLQGTSPCNATQEFREFLRQIPPQAPLPVRSQVSAGSYGWKKFRDFL